MKLHEQEQQQILEASAMLVVEAIEDAGPRALRAAADKLKEQADDFAVKATKRYTYGQLAQLMRQESRQ